MPRLILHYCCVVVCLLLPHPGRAECLSLNADIDGKAINSVSAYLKDETHRRSLDDIRTGQDSPAFTPLGGKSANFALSSAAYWLRFDVCNDKSMAVDWKLEVMFPLVHFMDIYQVAGGKVIAKKSISPATTYHDREHQYRRYMFDFRSDPGQRSHIYIAMRPDVINVIDMNTRIWVSNHYLDTIQLETILWGLFYGGMIMMLLYNTFIYLITQDRAYLFYIIYLPAIIYNWLVFSGHGHEYLWPDSPYLKQHSMFLSIGLATITATLFCRQFLGTRAIGGIDDRIIIICGLVGLLLLIITIFKLYIPAMIIVWNISLIPLLFILVGYRVYRSGYTPARYYMLSWSMLMVGTAIYGFLSLGITSFSLAVEMAGPTGAWLEAAFLSFALADRIKLLQRDKEMAETRLIQAQIEPHFLFNTLANISSLLQSNVARARYMLEQLDVYLRTTLQRTRRGNTTLGQELDLLEAYLAIIKIRMDKRLHYRIDVPRDYANISLPPLLLQPLVENAIRHGLEPKPEGGEIAITGQLQNNILLLEVKDSGVGFSDHRGFTGTGLSNVHERIRMLYGRSGKLEVMENPGGGVISRLQIPVQINQ